MVTTNTGAMRWAAALALAILPALPLAAKTAPAAAAASAAHDRFIAMSGGRNFRDVGGYRTADGRMVRWGLLYRSGSLGSLAPEGRTALAGLHPVAIVDLRTTQERGRDPDGWIASQPGYWSREYGLPQANMAAQFADPANRTPAAMRTMMIGAYRTLAQQQAPAYRELFSRLLAARGPVVVNCTAGKDRTGIATALVLTALGVPYQTVREDFLLSNGAPGMDTLQKALSGPLAALPPEAAAPIVNVEPAYLDTTFETLRKDYGSVDHFLAKELGVGPKERAALRRRMLAPA